MRLAVVYRPGVRVTRPDGDEINPKVWSGRRVKDTAVREDGRFDVKLASGHGRPGFWVTFESAVDYRRCCVHEPKEAAHDSDAGLPG